MRVIALVSLVLALSVSSLPVSNTPGSAEVSRLEGGIKSTVDGAKSASNSAVHKPSSRALPGSVGDTGAVPGQVEHIPGQVAGKVTDVTKAAPGTSNLPTAGNVNAPGPADQVLSKVEGMASPPSRRGTGVAGVAGTFQGAAGSILNKAKGAASGVRGKTAGTVGKMAGRGTALTPPGPGVAGTVPAQLQNTAKGVVSKVEGVNKGPSGTVGSVPAA